MALSSRQVNIADINLEKDMKFYAINTSEEAKTYFSHLTLSGAQSIRTRTELKGNYLPELSLVCGVVLLKIPFYVN